MTKDLLRERKALADKHLMGFEEGRLKKVANIAKTSRGHPMPIPELRP